MSVFDCIQYDDGELRKGPDECVKRLPEEGEVLAPWVTIQFESSGDYITVSNESSPLTDPENIACIKSFEFGHSNGLTVRVVVQDQEGGEFKTFTEHVLKHWDTMKKPTPPGSTMMFQFGWVKSGCTVPYPNKKSPCYSCTVTGLETSFSEGKFIVEITGVDIGHVMQEGYADVIKGSTDSSTLSMCLQDAVTDLLTKSPAPVIGRVRFARMENGVAWPCGFEYHDIDCECNQSTEECVNKGPKSKWSSEGQDKLQAAKRWVENWCSDRGKQWKMQYNFADPEGEMIFWEDRVPQCKAKGSPYWNSNCVGEFLVNGGKESNVIEFNPKFKWQFGATLTSGGGGIAQNAVGPLPPEGNTSGYGGAKSPGRRECSGLTRVSNEGAGHTTQIPVDESIRSVLGKHAMSAAQRSQAKAIVADGILTEAIQADLVILGSPGLLPPYESRAKNCYIKFLNPPYIVEDERTGKQDWLARPRVNEILTNRAWLVDSVTHRIQAGSFTTTIGVFLPAVGIHGNPDEPWGLMEHEDSWDPVQGIETSL